MKAAVVLGAVRTPVYAEFSEPEPAAGEARIAVTSAAIIQVVKSRASGQHYSSASTGWGGSMTEAASISSCRARPTGAWPNEPWSRGRDAWRFPTSSTT